MGSCSLLRSSIQRCFNVFIVVSNEEMTICFGMFFMFDSISQYCPSTKTKTDSLHFEYIHSLIFGLLTSGILLIVYSFFNGKFLKDSLCDMEEIFVQKDSHAFLRIGCRIVFSSNLRNNDCREEINIFLSIHCSIGITNHNLFLLILMLVWKSQNKQFCHL